MHYAILGLLSLLFIYGPFMWVRYVMHKHGKEQLDLPGTGAELAQHLLNRFEMNEVLVEETDAHNDHYDPEGKTVRLSPTNYSGRSLTAVAIAAHEVSHAIQFHRQEAITNLWGKYVPRANKLKRAGAVLFMAAPLFTAVVHTPAAALIPVAIAVVTLLASFFSYFFILPMELDASFRKALPILIEGEYVNEAQLPAVRQVLYAAAFTYIAVALTDIVRLWRWGRMVRPL
jgi:Zn-dependent membrane protease YugP